MNKAHRFNRAPRRTLLLASTLPLLLAVTACGDDSTAENPGDAASSSVPSVGQSASANAEPSAESSAPAPENNNHSGGAPAEDSGAEQVEEVPSGTGRSSEDQDYLNRLKDGKVDLSKAPGASEPGGTEDQLIAAGRGYCQSKEAGGEDVFTALAAGQLKTQGVVDGDPEDVQKTIVDAANEAYCS